MSGPVCIVGGTGALGFGLAVRFGRAGVSVVIGSRDGGRAEEAAARAAALIPDGSFVGRENAAAVADVELVILSVPFRSQSETLTNLKQALKPGQLVIDATVPLAAAVSGTVASISRVPGASASLRFASVSDWFRKGTLRITVPAARAAPALSYPVKEPCGTAALARSAVSSPRAASREPITIGTPARASLIATP